MVLGFPEPAAVEEGAALRFDLHFYHGLSISSCKAQQQAHTVPGLDVLHHGRQI